MSESNTTQMSKKVLVSNQDVKESKELKANVKIVEIQKGLEEIRNNEQEEQKGNQVTEEMQDE